MVERERECRADLPELADRTRADELFQLLRLRMVPVHERLHQQTALTVRRVEGALDRFRGASERLLAEDVLARLERFDRPGHVECVRQGDVDRLDVIVGEQRLVAPVRALDPLFARIGLRAGEVTARDGDHHGLLALASGDDDGVVDAGRRENPPANWLHRRIIYAP